MNYKISLCLFSLFFYNILYSLENHTNQMFMFTKSIYNAIGMQQAGWHDIGIQSQYHGSSVQSYVTYGQSFNSKDNAAYYLFDNKKELIIRGGSNPSGYTLTSTGYTTNNPGQDEITTKSFKRDILAQWFNYNNTTDLQDYTFTINPTQYQFAGIIEINQELKNFIKLSIFDLWYINIKIPITSVTNNLGLTGDAKAIEALTSGVDAKNNFKYANFYNIDKNMTRPSNIQLLLNTKYMNDRDAHMISGFGVSIPLIEQGYNIYLYEPLNGQNAHFGLVALGLFEFPILRKYEQSRSRVCYFLEFENNFLGRNYQLRTYDLLNKPYSRYMKLLDRKTNSLIPAVNVLTLNSRVEPFNLFNMATGFRFKYADSVGEIGYELWAHGTEVITPSPTIPWENDRYGIAFINEDGNLAKISGGAMSAINTNTEPGQTASESTINYIAPPDGTTICCSSLSFEQKNKYIQLKDLNTYSAAARSAITHRAYATISLCEKGKKRNSFVNLGAYIEIAQNNAALSYWGLWIKGGLTF